MTVLLFAGAAILSHRPTLPAPGVPVAKDVRAAKSTATALAGAARSDKPVVIAVKTADMPGIARVASNGVPRLRLGSRVDDETLHVIGALRVGAATWLNGEIIVTERPEGGYPSISARAGALPVPAPLVDVALKLAHKLIEWRSGARIPSPRQALLDFDARGNEVALLVDLPRGLLRAVGKAVPETDPIDLALTDRLYARAIDRYGGKGDVELSDVYALLFADAPMGAAARDHARAAIVATAMATVGPAVRRLAGGDPDTFKPRYPAVLRVRLGGRDDLPKHLSLSAALAVAADPTIGRALGTWKELDDSLPGGSGFSFVDLTADRAGLRLGQAALDPDRASRVAGELAAGAELLPMAALGFQEGMSDRAFVARYGDIATENYAAAVQRIDTALDTLPVMRR